MLTPTQMFLVCKRIIVAIILSVAFCAVGIAQESATGRIDTIDLKVRSGLEGRWKVGFSTWHRVEINATEELTGWLEIQTVDGDGNELAYSDPGWSFQAAPGSTAVVDIYAKHGRADRPIRIVASVKGRKALVHLLSESERGQALSATDPWVVGIGTSRLDLDQGLLKSANGRGDELRVSELTSLQDIPTNVVGYSGVDAIVFSSSNPQINEGFLEFQRKAIRDWLIAGGQLILTWGKGGPTLAKYPEFEELLPGPLIGSASDCEPGPIESLLGSQDRLDVLDASILKMTSGKLDVLGVTATRVRLPLIARWAYGTGSVIWLATEIDSPQLSDWETRPSLLKYLMKECWEKTENKPTRNAFLPYEDMSGQLNAMLDRFPDLQLGNLGHLVLIAGLLALLIGPLDYFFTVKFLRRPRLTWWTLSLCSLAAIATSSMLFRAWKPQEPSINTIEIIDIDDQTQQLHARGFAHCYGGKSGLFDFGSYHRSLSSKEDGSNFRGSNRLDWFGQPGKAIGGFESSVTSQLGLPDYRIHGNNPGSNINQLGIPTSGTKALEYLWQEQIEFPDQSNALSTVSGKDDLLQGSFSNPLNVDMLDGVLYFSGRAYTIPGRIRPGERVPISTSIPKDIMRRLQRKAFVAGQEQGIAWNPTDTDNLERLAELMSFFRSAGGEAYTGLEHRYLANLDCSDLLKLDRAILFARLPEPASKWTLQRDGKQQNAVQGKRLAMVRLFLNVQNANRSLTLLKDGPSNSP
ncbi:MAG: hypothetical protein ACKN9S_08110 [Pirellula sp.]